jgi:hypothetical protein
MAIFMGVMPGVFLKPMEPAVAKTVREVLPSNTIRNADSQAPGLRPQASGVSAPGTENLHDDSAASGLRPEALSLRPGASSGGR